MSSEIDDILNNIESADDAFISDIKKYWGIITGVENMYQFILEPLGRLKKQMPKVPDEEWKIFIDEYNIAAMEGDFINQFMNHYTHEELKSLLRLYDEHPLLKKAKEHNKIIMAETYKLNEKWTSRFMYLMDEKVRKWMEMGYIDSGDM